ncbi:serine threonine kinase fungal-specific transcription factor [Lecanosticta acicola]|uniref:Serine threonine kinase fungal-specific transcription factor n=1 Tax=Lecanosticta acicola TaxID=111012 RepID=A0AAI8YXX5_9PEZI|nr:serine threonine kinase fungal-specific transcription factor [Lecanosticta acicola]
MQQLDHLQRPLQDAVHSQTPATTLANNTNPSSGQPYAAGPLPRPAQAQATTGRMRSSIACVRCRRSKVKCVNNGVGTTCRSCENSGRECSYPSPVTGGGASRRRDSIPGRNDSYGDSERRQKHRKSAHTFVSNPLAARDSPRPIMDALDSRLLTPQIWNELFDIFQIHYSADLPFLHPPSFLKPLRSATAFPPPATAPAEDTKPSVAKPPAPTEFLLAFLALTTRFHPKLVAHHSPPTSTRASNPLIASEYYASAAAERMAAMWTDNRPHDIEHCQAMLMLGLHEWGMCRGAKAWLAVGLAIREAQAMGLQYELDLDDEPLSRSLALNGEAEKMGVGASRKSSSTSQSAEDAFIHQEIRRRTFWSCYIMDRYLSSGKYRPQMLHAKELRIQLPASERSFLFAEKVRTLMLGEEDKINPGTGRAEVQSQRQQSVLLGTGTPEPSMAPSPRSSLMRDVDDDKGRLEVGSDEGLVSRYVKILEIYGKVVQWSCAGGRRVEEYPPWDHRCQFHKLVNQCRDFKASLPRQHALTHQNTQAHISMKTSTPYLLVHTVYLLCQIMLHREYVPFIPIRCSKPEGPLDPPVFPSNKYDVPPDFWTDSARDCFRSAREIMDLVRTCQEWNALVETPIVGFSIYTVAFVGVYCMNFPWMDPDGYMCSIPDSAARPDQAKSSVSKGFEAARKALEMVGNMRTRLHMADGWFKTINRMHKYFRRMKLDYRKNAQTIESSSEGDSPVSTRHLSLREGGLGGGLDEFKLFERTLSDFGNLEDQDVEMTDARPDSRPLDAVYDDSSAGTTVKSEEPGDRGERPHASTEQTKSEGGAWSAINAVPGAPASRQPSISATPSSAQFRSYDSYSQGQQPPSQQSKGPQPLHSYPNHINNFRPVYSEASGSAGPPSSLTSPAAQSATGSTPQSRPSPPFERQHQHQQHPHQQSYGGWAAHNAQYPMQAPPPPPNPYTNGVTHHHSHSHSHATTPTPLHHHAGVPYPAHQQSGYPTPGHPGPPGHPQPHTQPQHAVPGVQQPVWDPVTKEQWLNSIDTRLGGDDVAAFVDGGELAEWATMASAQGFGGGWLSTVWGGAS